MQHLKYLKFFSILALQRLFVKSIQRHFTKFSCNISHIKNKFTGLLVDMLYYQCAKTYRLCKFKHLLHVLTLVEPCLGPYLQNVEYERWSMAHSEGRRYNIMTTNISECINEILVKEWELLVIALAEKMRNLVQRWHYDRWTEAKKCKTKLTPITEAMLGLAYQLSLRMHVSFHCSVICDTPYL